MHNENYYHVNPFTPQNPSKPQGIPQKVEEKSSKFLIVYTSPAEFRGYELQNFIEEMIQSSVDNISVFCDQNGEKIGIVAVELSFPITHSKLSKILQKPFKGVTLQIRAFPAKTDFQKFLEIHSVERLESINFTRGKHTPLVYVQNFIGDSQQLKEIFNSVGNIQLVRLQKVKFGNVFIIYFDDEDSALKACRTFNNITPSGQTTPIIVKSMYKSASSQYFAVCGLNSKEECEELCSNYGTVNAIKTLPETNGFTFYIYMEDLDQSKTACALLNGLQINDCHIRTFFITNDRFNQIE